MVHPVFSKYAENEPRQKEIYDIYLRLRDIGFDLDKHIPDSVDENKDIDDVLSASDAIMDAVFYLHRYLTLIGRL